MGRLEMDLSQWSVQVANDVSGNGDSDDAVAARVPGERSNKHWDHSNRIVRVLFP